MARGRRRTVGASTTASCLPRVADAAIFLRDTSYVVATKDKIVGTHSLSIIVLRHFIARYGWQTYKSRHDLAELGGTERQPGTTSEHVHFRS